MDVIALDSGGFPAAVAPLGTAVTEHQLQLFWRIAPEPVIALDGDTAGLRAAMKLIDLALPLLEAGQSLRFAILPEGQDPDDLIRGDGPAAVQRLIDNATPMVRLLWQRETEGKTFDSPERKAALDKALRDKIKLIRDPSIRSHYGQEINALRRDLFAPKRKARGPWVAGRKPAQTPLASTKTSLIAASGDAAETRMREAVILATLIATPAAITQFEAGIERMECSDPDFRLIRDIILRHGAQAPDSLREEIIGQGGGAALENLFALRHVAINPSVRSPGDVERACMTLGEELAKLEAHRGWEAEIADAVEDLAHVADEALTWRLGQAAEARNAAMRSQHQDRTEYDTGDNGARISRDERDAFAALLDQIGHSKRQQ